MKNHKIAESKTEIEIIPVNSGLIKTEKLKTCVTYIVKKDNNNDKNS